MGLEIENVKAKIAAAYQSDEAEVTRKQAETTEIGDEMNGLGIDAVNTDMAVFTTSATTKKTKVTLSEKEEREKAAAQVLEFMLKDQSESYTKKLENIRQGFYQDENGKIQSLGIRPEGTTEVHVYPSNEYQEQALASYLKNIMTKEMDVRMRMALKKLKEEGKLDSLSDAELVKEVMKTAGVPEDDKVFEQFVDKRKDVSKIMKRHDKVMNRREELKKVSQDEIDRKLTKKTRESLKDYMEAHKNEDGTYDLSEISEAIEYRTGKDYIVNRYDDKSKTLYEVKQVRKELVARDILNGGKLDKENGPYPQVKDLIDFCEYKMEDRNRVPSLIEAGMDIFNGAASGVAAHVFAMQETGIELNYYETQITNIINGNVTVTHTDFDYKQVIQMFDVWKNTGAAIIAGGLTSLALGMLEDVIFGRDVIERECFDKSDYDPNNIRYTNKNQYIAYLKKVAPSEYEKIEPILKNYPVKEGKKEDEADNWDHNKFFGHLNVMAGLGSNLNCAEIAGAKLFPEEKKFDAEPAKEKKIYKSENKVNYNFNMPDKEVEVSEDSLTNGDKIIFNKEAKRSSWKHLAENIYDCNEDGKSLSDVFGQAKAIRIIKIAQAITDGDYSRERMEKLYELSLKGASKLKGIDGVDYGVYYSMLTGNFPSEIKLPKELAGVKRCDVSEDEHELKLGYKLSKDQLDPNRAAANGPAKGKYKKIEKGSKVEGGAVVYYFKDEEGKIHTFSDKAQWEAAVKEAEERLGKEAKEVQYDRLNQEDPEAETEE